MRLVDLFSGIGGFSLSASWVWGDNLDIVCFCERDEFCRKVLNKHWPNVPIVEDIYDIERIVAYANSNGSESRRAECAGQQRHVTPNSANISVDILTAGFPCQPASCAGPRKGTADDRWLWPPLLEAIQELKPRWLLLENVPGLLSLEGGMVFEQCLADMEDEGYEVQPLRIPACGVNAPHRRERLWIVGHSSSQRRQQNSRSPHGYEGKDEGWSKIQGNKSASADSHAAHTNREHGNDAGLGSGKVSQQQETGIQELHIANAGCAMPQKRSGQKRQRSLSAIGGSLGERPGWYTHWHEAAAKLCRVDDGVSRRVDRLKALGNSIVPQVAARIMQAIKETDSAWATETTTPKNH